MPTIHKEVVDHMMENDFFSQWLGIEVLEIKEGYSKIKMTVRKEMVNGFGIVHPPGTHHPIQARQGTPEPRRISRCRSTSQFQKLSRPKFQHRYWVHVLLFLLTLFTTTYMTWIGGWSYSMPILTILGAHEFGHYFYCRKYGVDASLPYFLPAPLFR